MPVIVVTDSTSGLPGELVDGARIRVVPLHVLVGADDFREGADAAPPRSGKSAEDYTSSAASPGEMEHAYTEALKESGGDGVVAIHLSKGLSGTWDAARQAADRVGPRVRIVDSGSAGMSVGMAALETADVARSGAALDEVYETAVAASARAFSLVYIHRMDDLRRGGRLAGASSMMSSALSVRVLLRMGGGTLEVRDKMRIPSKGLRKLVDNLVDDVGGRRVRLAIQHWQAPDRADALEQSVRERLGDEVEVLRSELGPVLGLHLGPGSAAVSVLPAAAEPEASADGGREYGPEPGVGSEKE